MHLGDKFYQIRLLERFCDLRLWDKSGLNYFLRLPFEYRLDEEDMLFEI